MGSPVGVITDQEGNGTGSLTYCIKASEVEDFRKKRFSVNYTTYRGFEVIKLDKINDINEIIRPNEVRSRCSMHVFTRSSANN